MIDPPFAFVGLMHDATEAYVGDVSAPLKKAMRWLMATPSPYDIIEGDVWRVIAKRFNLPEILPPEVKEADMRMLATEKKMLGREPQSWNLNVEPYSMTIDCWTASEARHRFMHRFEELTDV